MFHNIYHVKPQTSIVQAMIAIQNQRQVPATPRQCWFSHVTLENGAVFDKGYINRFPQTEAFHDLQTAF
jgi:hypothetical protein